jgi:two-component system cell cycle sensor histidine kinase/response regulator CckA
VIKSSLAGKQLQVAITIAAALAMIVTASLVATRLQSSSNRASSARVELANIRTLAVKLQTMPWDADRGPGAPARARNTMQATHKQINTILARLARVGENNELSRARFFANRDYAALSQLRELVAHGQTNKAIELNGHYEHYLVSEFQFLDVASSDFDRTARNAVTAANIGTTGAMILTVLTSAFLFWRFRRASSAAGAASALSDSLVESSVDGVFAFDRNRRYTVWNRACEELTGMSRDEMLGRTPTETLLPLASPQLDVGAKALHGEKAELLGNTMSLPRRGERTFDIAYAPIYDATGSIVGGLGHLRDVTERHAMEQQLRQAQKLEAVGQLAGGIAHDFNNLLMAIGGYSSLALGHANGNEELRSHLTQVEVATHRAGDLTQQLLGFAQLQVRQEQVLDLNEVVRQAGSLTRPLLGPTTELILDLASKPTNIDADPTQLQHLLRHLTENARDAMPEGGSLTITTRNNEDHVELAVTDTGCGIPDNVKPRIFEPFFTTKGVGEGSGLGLASVYGVVEQSGGTISVESEIGKGATFTIIFATARTREPITTSEVPKRRAPGHSPTILLVEDNVTVLELVKAALEVRGYDVVSAATPLVALTHVDRGGVFDLLVTDVVMPELNGIELAVRLRAATSQPFRTIYMSGYPRSGFTLDEHSVFLQKPFELGQLFALADSLLTEAA